MLEKQIINVGDQFSANQRTLLDLIRKNQPVKRSELTEQTNLTQQSVHRIVSSLEDSGLLHSTPGIATGPGKPSPVLNLMTDSRFGVGILVNTDSVVICVADLSCKARITQQFEIDISERHAALDRIQAKIAAILADNDIPDTAVCGIGFTLPGFFVSKNKMFNAPEPLKDWSLLDLQSELTERFNLPVFLENSANAGAVGETLGPIGRKYKDFVYLGFDYGFGGAIVIDGKLHTGRAGNAGEMSAIFMGDEVTERPAMAGLLKHLLANGVLLSGIDDLKRNFDPNWPGLDTWVERTLPHLNRLIFGLTGILDPEAIVFGGQIAPELAEILINRVRFPDTYRYDAPPPLPDLIAGTTTDNPAANGVAQLPLKHIYFR